MRFIAGKLQKVDDELRDWGASLPEAAGWTNLQAYLNDGSVIPIPENDAEAVVIQHGPTAIASYVGEQGVASGPMETAPTANDPQSIIESAGLTAEDAAEVVAEASADAEPEATEEDSAEAPKPKRTSRTRKTG